MKLLLTEEYPALLAHGLHQITQLSHDDHAFGHIDEVYPQPPHSRASWYRPALDDGWMLLTMAADIRRHPQRLAVWRSTGLVVLFPTPGFARLTFPGMAASLLAQLSKLAGIYRQRAGGGVYRIEPTNILPI